MGKGKTEKEKRGEGWDGRVKKRKEGDEKSCVRRREIGGKREKERERAKLHRKAERASERGEEQGRTTVGISKALGM